MGRKNRVIITKNKEIYEQFSKLNFDSEVMMKDTQYVTRILNKINSKGVVLDSEKLGNNVRVRKRNPVKLDVYWR